MSRQYVYETRDLVDAGVFHYNVRATCPCGHSAILESIDLWWWFNKRGWNDRLRHVPARLRCSACKARRRPRRAPSIELVMEEATTSLPMVPNDVWKRELRRRR